MGGIYLDAQTFRTADTDFEFAGNARRLGGIPGDDRPSKRNRRGGHDGEQDDCGARCVVDAAAPFQSKRGSVMGDDEVKILCLLTGGKCYRVKHGGRNWYIEMHSQMGPCMLKANGDPVQNYNYPSGFWKAVKHLESMIPAERQRSEV